MKTFDSIEQALEYTVNTLIPQNHAYIINVLGPKEDEANRAATVQVVAQHMIYNDGNCGLTLNLPFDPSSGEFAHLVEFMGSSFRELCDEYKVDGIPCFALRFGVDVDRATKAIRFLLAEVYGYNQPTTFKCEVHDESSPATKTIPKRYTLEIVPGKSIGPFRLGMTIKEIDDALRSFSPEPLTLKDLEITASCHDDRGNWKSLEGSDRCEKLEIIVINSEHTIMLLGERVNDIERDAARVLLALLGSPVITSYACYDVPERGISAIRWEYTDYEIYCFDVTQPTKPNVAREARSDIG